MHLTLGPHTVLHCDEALRRLALACSVLAGALLVLLQPAAATRLADLAVLLTALDLLTAQTCRPAAHWRTAAPLGLTVLVDVVLNVDKALGYNRFSPVVNIFRSLGIGISLLVTAGVSLAVLWVAPVPSLPPLQGPHKRVGTCSFTIPITLPPGSQLYKHREQYPLTVQAWFPLAPTAPNNGWCGLGRWFPSLTSRGTLWTSGNPQTQTAEATALLAASAKSSSLKPFLLKHLALARSNSEFFDSPAHRDLSSSSSPPSAVLYSHGMYSWRQISSITFENLASHGHTVFACDHCPSAMLTRHYEGGGKTKKEGKGKSMEGYDYDLPEGMQVSTTEEREHYQAGLDTRTHEIVALMDYLQGKGGAQWGFAEPPGREAAQGKSELQFHLMGHSFGAGTMAAVACRDKRRRVASCVLLDSWMYPLRSTDLSSGLGPLPTLFVSSELWTSVGFQAASRHELLKTSPNALSVVVRDSTHTMYCDLHLLGSPRLLRLFDMAGPSTDIPQFVLAMNQLILGFITSAEDRRTKAIARETERREDGLSIECGYLAWDLEGGGGGEAGCLFKREQGESPMPHRDFILREYFPGTPSITTSAHTDSDTDRFAAETSICAETGSDNELPSSCSSSSSSRQKHKHRSKRGTAAGPLTVPLQPSSGGGGEDAAAAVAAAARAFMGSFLVDESSLPQGSSRLTDFLPLPSHPQSQSQLEDLSHNAASATASATVTCDDAATMYTPMTATTATTSSPTAAVVSTIHYSISEDIVLEEEDEGARGGK